MDLGFWQNKPKATKINVLPSNTEQDNPQGFTDKELDLYNQVRNMEKRFSDIDKGMDEIVGNDYRAVTISDWLNAMRQADQPYNRGYVSSWVEMFDIYANMLTDTHIQGAVDTLVEGVQSAEFFLSDEKGNKLEDVTKIFKSQWFYDYMEMNVNVKLYGFGLIQLKNFDPSDLSIEVADINRKHVRPDLNGLVKQQYDQQVWKDWNKSPYKDWTIYLFDAKLGKLNACARWFIYKTEIVRFWAMYNQLYGIPPVMAKTAIKDVTRKNNAINMLKKWAVTRWMVIDKEDEIIPFNTNGGANGQQFFENLIRLADEQMSKALLGSTMVLDNGSSKSQSETHADNTARFIKSLQRFISFSTNKELIPRLRAIGMPIPKGAQFMWDRSEKLTMKERAEVVNTLTNTQSGNYDISAEVVTEFVGIEVIEREKVDNELQPKNPITGALENYKNLLK